MPPGCSTIRGRPPRSAAKLAHQLCGKRALPLQSTQSRPSIQSKTAAQGSPLTLPKNAPSRPPTNSAESTRQPNRKVFTKAVKQTAIPTSALPRFLYQKYTSKKLYTNMIHHKNPSKIDVKMSKIELPGASRRLPGDSRAAPGRLQARETIWVRFQGASGASGSGSLRDPGKLLLALGDPCGHQIGPKRPPEARKKRRLKESIFEGLLRLPKITKITRFRKPKWN